DRIVHHSVKLTPQQLAAAVGDHGQTMVLATMDGSRKKENMIQQQVAAIDFDNSETRLNAKGEVIKDENGKEKKFKTEGRNYSSVA
ncbi:hypothetical protein QP281_25285, partial [Escherichia coli]|nr:hypothetical protein [Escherichia coli]